MIRFILVSADWDVELFNFGYVSAVVVFGATAEVELVLIFRTLMPVGLARRMCALLSVSF